MIEGVGGTDLGGQAAGMKWVHPGLETVKIGPDNDLQLFGCIHTKENKVLLGVEQRSIIT